MREGYYQIFNGQFVLSTARVRDDRVILKPEDRYCLMGHRSTIIDSLLDRSTHLFLASQDSKFKDEIFLSVHKGVETIPGTPFVDTSKLYSKMFMKQGVGMAAGAVAGLVGAKTAFEVAHGTFEIIHSTKEAFEGSELSEHHVRRIAPAKKQRWSDKLSSRFEGKIIVSLETIRHGGGYGASQRLIAPGRCTFAVVAAHVAAAKL